MKIFLPYIQSYIETKITRSYEGQPYLRGKCITIDIDQKAVDSLVYPKLSDTLRAQSPQEVGTVVLIRWYWEKEGYYTDAKTGQVTGDAYWGFAKVSIVDWQDKMLIGEEIFTGDAPASGLTRAGDYKSQQPIFKVVQYLESLPKR